MLRKLAVAASILVFVGSTSCGNDGSSGTGGSGGQGGFSGSGGSGGSSGGSGGAGGTGGGNVDTCDANTLLPGDPIQLAVTGGRVFSGQMDQIPGPVGCQVSALTSNRDAVIGYADANSMYTFGISWNLSLDSSWDGKTNANLVGQTIHYVKNGPQAIPNVYLGVTGLKTKYYGEGGAITIQEIDPVHIKGCVHSFTKWMTLDGSDTVTVTQPIPFNCHLF